jgi:hypothetical protein
MRVIASVLAVGALAVACTGKRAEPSSTSGASGSPSPSSTSTGAPHVVPLHSGSATVRMSGGLDEHLKLPLAPPGASIWGRSTGQISLKYLTRDGDALLINGSIPGPSARTSTALTLSFVIQRGGAVAFSSSRGECQVTIRRSETKSVRGSFTCSKLRSLGKPRKVVTAAGAFSGSD